MAFDATEPTDTTKIRNLGTVIRPNWTAIQTADSSFKPNAINFTDRTVASIAVNPTAIADAYIAYCKTDASGNSELFGINDLSGVIQFTRGIPTLTAAGNIFLPGGVLIQWKTQVATSDTIQTFDVTFGAVPFYVNFVVVDASMPDSRVFTRINGEPTTTGFKPIILNGSGAAQSKRINYIAIGIPA